MKNALWAIFFLLVSIGPGWGQDKPVRNDKPPIYLHGGHLVDVIRGEVYPDIGVLIEGDKITGLFFDFPYNARRVPANAVRVDLSGKFLIPGMFDMHIHANASYRGQQVDLKHFFKMFLAGGVTTVHAMSDDTRELIRLKTYIDAGESDGPNIIVASSPAMEQAPGFPKFERSIILNDVVDARRVVRDEIYKGAEWIKFYNYGDAEIVSAVVDETHKLGRLVFGHFSMIGAAEASRLGVDSLEHTVSLLQHALDYKDSIAMNDIGYYRLFAMWPRVNQQKLDAIFKVMVENKTAIVPTIIVNEVVTDPQKLVDRSAEWLDLYQPHVRDAYLADLRRTDPAYELRAVLPEWRKGTPIQAQQMARLVNMGGIVVTGTDLTSAPPLVPGLGTHQEMKYFVDGGMTPLQALRAATIEPAKVIRWQDRLGSIEVGKQADIVAIGRNPLVDITAVSDIHTVIKAGKVYPMNTLRDELRNAAKAK